MQKHFVQQMNNTTWTHPKCVYNLKPMQNEIWQNLVVMIFALKVDVTESCCLATELT